MDKPQEIITYVDGCSLAYASGHAEHIKEAEFAFDGYIKQIKEAVAAYGCTRLVGFVESWRWKNIFRQHIATRKEYKGSRKGKDRPAYVNEIKRYACSKYGWKQTYYVEAEDAMLISANKHGIAHSIMCSCDKDTRQQWGLHFDPFKREFISITQEQADRNLWRQVLSGDSVDSIPGLRGIGTKRANDIIDGIAIEDLPRTVACAYIKAGHDYSMFLEQCRLIYLLRSHTDCFTPMTLEQWEALEQSVHDVPNVGGAVPKGGA